MIFSGKPSDREYWLGKKQGFGPGIIEGKYRALKPCLHGSDAHVTERVAAPNLERACWIKADLTFDGLRQAVIEPEHRVAIGKEPPLAPADHERIAAVSVSDGPWFSNGRLELNPGLVAIIGARGSGKTALADILACATGALTEDAGDASFLRRASHPENLLSDAIATVEWADGDHAQRGLASEMDFFDGEHASPRVRYLSQQFVERLCSADGLAGDLVREIEAVVFQAIDETERLGASSFAELREIHVEPLHRRQNELCADMERTSQQIAAEDATHEKVPALSESRKQIGTRIEAATRELNRLIPKGKEERAKRLAALDVACKEAEKAVQQLKLGRQNIEELALRSIASGSKSNRRVWRISAAVRCPRSRGRRLEEVRALFRRRCGCCSGQSGGGARCHHKLPHGGQCEAIDRHDEDTERQLAGERASTAARGTTEGGWGRRDESVAGRRAKRRDWAVRAKGQEPRRTDRA